MPKMELGIIIPTIARPYLSETIQAIKIDALASPHIETKIFVVSDGDKAFEENDAKLHQIRKWESGISLVHLKNTGTGVSSALNTGLNKINREGLFMIFTDDDSWIHGRIKKLTLEIMKEGAPDLLLAKSIVRDERGSKLRPTRNISESENILEYLYAGYPLLTNPTYFSLASSIAKGHLASIPFRTEVTSHEDVIWLYNVQELGFRVSGTDVVAAELFVSLERSYLREAKGQEYEFLEWLKRKNSKVYVNYRWVHAMRAASKFGKFIDNFRYYRKYEPSS